MAGLCFYISFASFILFYFRNRAGCVADFGCWSKVKHKDERLKADQKRLYGQGGMVVPCFFFFLSEMVGS